MTVTAVNFGTTPATSFTVNSATQITAVSPPGTGIVNVRVVTTQGTSATGVANQFSYVLNAYYGGTVDWVTPTGTGASLPESIIDAAYITGLVHTLPNPVSGSAMPLDIVIGHRNTLFAYPAALPLAASIFQQGLGMDIKTAFTQRSILIDGVNYRVYFLSTEFPFPVAERFTLTIS